MLQRMQHTVIIVGSSAIQQQCYPSLTMSQEGDRMTMKQIAQPCDLSKFTSYYNTWNIYLSVFVHNQVLSNLTWHKQKQTWFLSNYQIKRARKSIWHTLKKPTKLWQHFLHMFKLLTIKLLQNRDGRAEEVEKIGWFELESVVSGNAE